MLRIVYDVPAPPKLKSQAISGMRSGYSKTAAAEVDAGKVAVDVAADVDCWLSFRWRNPTTARPVCFREVKVTRIRDSRAPKSK